ncbi:MAG: hypothetical protein Q9M36_10115 [Sulfurovum sp.]|nr:hypothetical protein [Sulfurovum sp.]
MNEPTSSNNELLDKIHDKVSQNKQVDEPIVEETPVGMSKYLKAKEPEEALSEELEDAGENQANDSQKTPKKRSWLKIFFFLLSIVLLFNIAYIVYLIDYKTQSIQELEVSEVYVEIVKPSEEIKAVEEVEEVVKKIDVVELVREITTLPKVDVPEVKALVEKVEVIAKNPDEYIDVIEIRSTSPKENKILKRALMTTQERQAFERQEAKALLFEQMNH